MKCTTRRLVRPKPTVAAIGLVFTDRESVERALVTDAAINTEFVIKPHDPNSRVEAIKKFGRDTLVLAFSPHMHVRGKSFQYEIIYDDSHKEILLDVPQYDFNWQNAYILDQPLLIPAGATLQAVAYFDNSDGNLANPDPSKEIRWGLQSWDEMMIGFFDCGVSIERARQLLAEDLAKLQVERAKKRAKVQAKKASANGVSESQPSS